MKKSSAPRKLQTGAPSNGTRALKPWTVAIYMVADGQSGSSDLDQVALRELASIIEAAGKHVDYVNVAVQLDLRGVEGTLRLLVKNNKEVFGQSMPEKNSAKIKTLQEFLQYVTDESRTQNYLLLFWGHSSGPVVFVGDFDVPTKVQLANGNGAAPAATQGLGVNALSQALDSPGVLQALAGAIKEKCDCFTSAKKSYRDLANVNCKNDLPIDIVLFKECFMSTLETAFELLDYVQFMIASQAKVPRLDWPYEEIFKSLAENEEASKAAGSIAEALGRFYEVSRKRCGKDEVPVSIIDVPGIKSSIERVATLVDRLQQDRPSERTAAVRNAFDRSAIGDSSLVDVKVLTNLQDITGERDLGKAAADLAKNLFGGNPVAVKLARPNSAFGGISLFYFPDPLDALGPVAVGGSFIAPVVARHPERYRELNFHTATKWSNVALERLGGWNENIFKSFGKEGKTLDFTTLDRFNKASALGDVFRRADDIELDNFGLDRPFDVVKTVDFAKLGDFVKTVDFAKLGDFVKTVDFANVPHS